MFSLLSLSLSLSLSLFGLPELISSFILSPSFSQDKKENLKYSATPIYVTLQALFFSKKKATLLLKGQAF